MDSLIEQIRDILDELESDGALKDTSDWHHVSDRYEENMTKLKELVEEL